MQVEFFCAGCGEFIKREDVPGAASPKTSGCCAECGADTFRTHPENERKPASAGAPRI